MGITSAPGSQAGNHRLIPEMTKGNPAGAFFGKIPAGQLVRKALALTFIHLFFSMLDPVFDPFPILYTERLILRRITLEDTADIFYFRTDPEILRYLGRGPARDMEAAAAFIRLLDDNLDKKEGIQWGIEWNERPGKLAGTICYWRMDKDNFRGEIGYLLAPGCQGKGLMREAIRAVLAYGFEVMGLHSVEARLTPENKASAAVLEATGFRLEAHFREDFYYNGKFEDTLVYSCLSTDAWR